MNQQKIIFIRHAESAQNLAAREAINSTLDFVKAKKESLKVKWDPSLIDCGLTEAGIQQCLNAASTFNTIQLDEILVSPLRRAIQTAFYLFRNHPNKPKFVVVPFLREMLTCSCDIGGNLIQTMAEFPQFDFSRVLNNEFLKQYPNMWTMEFVYNQEQKQLLQQYIAKIENVNLNEKGPSLILSYLSQYPSKSVVETLKDMMHMVQTAKDNLAYYKGKRIACVTHSRFLLTLSAHNFDEQCKPINGKQIKNCEYVNIEI